MLYYRCKCGKRTAWSSMGVEDCNGCEECKTTLATGPDSHRPLADHKWELRYDQHTGQPKEYICINCCSHKPLEDGKVDSSIS